MPSQTLTSVGSLEWLDIPRFQRGISWKVEDVEEFLYSQSILLGNVILGDFPVNGLFPNLPSGYNKYLVLIDGLQRFAIGTMLLSILHHQVLSANPSRANQVSNFQPIVNTLPRSADLVYLHNDHEFQNHPRRAIAHQYTELRNALEQYINSQFVQGKGQTLATGIISTFLKRQIALDVYFNFSSPLEIMNTFLGINTVRVDLGTNDLIRAYIIEKGYSSGWTEADIDDVENEFTKVFTQNNKPDQNFAPFANIVLDAIVEKYAGKIFPSWNINLWKNDVDNFIDFVENFKNGNLTNPYVNEIKDCGNVPYAILISSYYYEYLQNGTQPSFFTGGINEDPDLHKFLIACYRGFLEGGIARARDFAEKIIKGTQPYSLSQVSDDMSMQFVGKRVADTLDYQWLKGALGRINKDKAKRIFNAMLLPAKQNGFGTQVYDRIIFGTAAAHFHVDHLIPEVQIIKNTPGAMEAETIRNFSPLPANQNRVAKATNCASKLVAGGIYDHYINGSTHFVHPYARWLMQNHYGLVSNANALNNTSYLEPNSNPDIGSSRLIYLTNDLLSKI